MPALSPTGTPDLKTNGPQPPSRALNDADVNPNSATNHDRVAQALLPVPSLGADGSPQHNTSGAQPASPVGFSDQSGPQPPSAALKTRVAQPHSAVFFPDQRHLRSLAVRFLAAREGPCGTGTPAGAA